MSAIKEPYKARQQSTRHVLAYFQIGSRRTLYKVLRFAGCRIAPPAPAAIGPAPREAATERPPR